MNKIQISSNSVLVRVPTRSNACFKMAGALAALGVLLWALDR